MLFVRSCTRPLVIGGPEVEGLTPSDRERAAGGGRGDWGFTLEDVEPTGEEVFATRWSRALRASALNTASVHVAQDSWVTMKRTFFFRLQRAH